MDQLPRELLLEISLLIGLDDDSTDATHFAHCSKRLHSILNPEIQTRRKHHFIHLVNTASPYDITLFAEDFLDTYGCQWGPLDDSAELESHFECLSMTVGLGEHSHKDALAILSFLTRCSIGHIDLTVSRLDIGCCTKDLARPCQGRLCGFRLAKAIIQASSEVPNVQLRINIGQGIDKDEEESPFEFWSTPVIPILAVIPPTPITSPKSPKHFSLQTQNLMDPAILKQISFKRPQSAPSPPTSALYDIPINGFHSFAALYHPPKVRVRTTSTMSQMPLEVTIRYKLRHVSYPLDFTPTLQCFSLTNPRLFQASIYDLTIDILSSSTLTCLTLDLMPFNILIWSQIFASISLPSLLELHIGKLEVAWPDLEAFFQRHGTIKILDLERNLLVGRLALPEKSKSSESDGVFKPLFPRVEVLKANTEYLAPLLQDPLHLPFLHQLEICPTTSSYPGDPYSLQVYDAIVSRNEADSFYFSSIKQVNLGYVRDSSFLEWAFQPYIKKPKNKGEGKRRLPEFKGVETIVYCGPPIFTTEVVDAVCAWLMDDGITPARTLNTRSRGKLFRRLLIRVCPSLTLSEKSDDDD